MRVGLIGTGVVGRRAARELVARAEVERLVILTGTSKERARLSDSLGPKVEASPAQDLDVEALSATGLDAVVLCTPDDVQPDGVRLALEAGCHVVSLADSVESIDAILGVDDYARDVGRAVVLGATLSPGWSTLLARHAAALFDEIDEISIAVTGTAGPACHDRRVRASRADTQEWRDGEWVECSGRSSPELVWFPDPLAAVECARGDLSEALLLRRVLPDVAQLVVKMGRPPARPIPDRVRRFRRSPAVQESGAVRVAVSGRADGQPATVVYGLLAAPAAATAVLAAIAATALDPAPAAESAAPEPGVHGVAEVLDPVASLATATERGVRAFVYEGID